MTDKNLNANEIKTASNENPAESNATDTSSDFVGATESRLLQAMSVDDSATAEVQPTALPDYKAFAGTPLAEGVEKISMFDVIAKLRTVYDPEIPINVYDMGLIYRIKQVANGDIFIDMTLTAPTCPIAGILPQQVADAVAELEGTGKIEVKLVWEPAWTIDRLTDEAREMLELL